MTQPESHPEHGHEPEDEPSEPGAEGGSGSESSDDLPAEPSHDEAPAGDTDQHSDTDA